MKIRNFAISLIIFSLLFGLTACTKGEDQKKELKEEEEIREFYTLQEEVVPSAPLLNLKTFIFTTPKIT